MKYFNFWAALCLSVFAEAQLSFEQQQVVLKKLNQIRAKGCRCGVVYYPPAGPLDLNETLSRVAQKYAEEIAQRGELSHIGKNGTRAGDRLKKEGYLWSYYGENIAVGHRTVSEVLKAWLDSPSHCRTLMNPHYVHLGVGYHNHYWVTDFGTPKSKI